MPHVEGHKKPARTRGEIAQAKYDTAQKLVDEKKKHIGKLEGDLAKAKAKLVELEAARDYAAAHPALPKAAGTEAVSTQQPDAGIQVVDPDNAPPASTSDSHVAGHKKGQG